MIINDLQEKLELQTPTTHKIILEMMAKDLVQVQITGNPRKTNNNRYNNPEPLTGIAPLFLTNQSQRIAKVFIGEEVTTECMYRMVPKSDLIADMATRLAISDFTPFKKEILAYPRDEMLLHYDPEYKYGQNFFLCINTDVCDSIAIISSDVETVSDNEFKKKRNKVQATKKWESYGSEQEIQVDLEKYLDDFITLKFSKKRNEFRLDCHFEDSVADSCRHELKSYPDANHELKKHEMNIGIQAVPKTVSTSMQTPW